VSVFKEVRWRPKNGTSGPQAGLVSGEMIPLRARPPGSVARTCEGDERTKSPADANHKLTQPEQPETPQPEAHHEYGTLESARTQDTGRPESCMGTRSDSELAAIDPSKLTVISDRLEQLQTLFQTKIREDEQQRKWIMQLTSELAQYRDDFIYKNVTSKVFRDLIQLHDTLDQTLDPAVFESISKGDLASRLRNLQKQLLKTFDRQSLEQIKSDARARFDESEQEAIDVRSVDRPEDDGIVFGSARCGFRYGPRLLRPESVIVGRYESKNEETDD
jgi:molecular chaperone GrpE (heat shock protein)